MRKQAFDPVSPRGADLVKNVKRTSALGGCQVKTLPAGTYTITASKAGYADQTVTVHVNDGGNE